MSDNSRSDYPQSAARQGITEESLRRIQVLHRRLRGPFSVADAANAIGLNEVATRKMLAYLVNRGWLTRVRQGLYLVPPLDASGPTDWREDPWVVAARTFAPCYLGGWSACEYWGLTDQLFREILVVTSRRVRQRRVVIQGTPYLQTVRAPDRLFGTRVVWRGQVLVPVSDPSRTVVDILDDPQLGGGMRHVVDILENYFGEEHRADTTLIKHAIRFGNRTVFKRLGYLVERLGLTAPDLVAACLAHKSSGVTRLDPAEPAGGGIDRRWGLEINVQLEQGVSTP